MPPGLPLKTVVIIQRICTGGKNKMSELFIDYSKVLADLESKRDALNDAINGIKKLLHVNSQMLPDGTFTQPVSQLTTGQDIPSDAFFGMPIRDAIKKFLTMKMKKPQQYREIADALEQGGFEHKSKSFHNTVNTTLTRLAGGDDPVVVKVQGKWGLLEWYPDLKRKKTANRKEENGVRQEEETDAEGESTDVAGESIEAIPVQPSLPNEPEQPLGQFRSAA